MTTERVWLDPDDLDAQNPQWRDSAGVVWFAAHCCVCGTYTHDQRSEPGVDYLCEICMEDEDA